MFTQMMRLPRVLGDPRGTFAEIADHSPVIGPALALMAATLIVQFYMSPITSAVAMNEMQARMGPEGVEQVREAIELGQRIGVLLGPLVQVVQWLFVAGVLWIAATLISPKATFRSVVAVVIHASVPITLFAVYSAVILTLRAEELSRPADLMVSAGLDLVFDASPAVGAILGRLGLFQVWHGLLLWYGLQAVAQIDGRRAAAIVVGYWSVITAWAVIASTYVVG